MDANLDKIGSHPQPPFEPSPLRKSIADASSATQLIPAKAQRIADVSDIQVATSADTTITVRESGGGPTLLKQQILKGSTPLPPFRSLNPNTAIEIIASGAVALEVDGNYRYD